MRTTNTRLLLLFLLLLAYGMASAVEYRQVLPNESTVTFAYTQMGVTLDGKFDRFTSELSFDPARPDKAQARVEIAVASIDTGSSEANEEVVGKAWFDTRQYPAASFVSTGLKALGGDRYEASGKLTIKGRTQEVKVPVTFSAAGSRGKFDGTLSINRLDYAIGEGVWADTDTVANKIQIRFHLVVNAAPGRKK